jgi:hypothetical protein
MQVINIRDHPNWRKEGAVYIGRGSIFGNPFRIGIGGSPTREEVIEKYRAYFDNRIYIEEDVEFLEAVEGLRGKTLACYCAPLPSHGDVIKDYLEITADTDLPNVI